MATLLQIHEPGETPLPHEDTTAIGIDLGTTHSVVAVFSNGRAEPIHDHGGSAIVPSIVQYRGTQITVGMEARRAYAEGEEGVVSSIKRLMGRSAQDIIGDSAYTIIPGEEGVLRLNVNGRSLTPVEISSHILGHLRDLAADALGREVRRAVITVPAYFDDAARAATKDAARIAGLEVLRLINEPTAAALAYGLDSDAHGLIAIYDFGGGTFDISILKLEAGVFQVLATAGDVALGGDDIDREIARYVLHATGKEAATLSAAEMGELLSACRAAKEALTTEEGEVPVRWHNGGISLSRATLETVMAPLVARTIAASEAALVDAGLMPEQITEVVLVGGSTRIPYVKAQVAQCFGKTPLDSIDPDMVVAMGAAIQANALTKGADHLLLDVIALSLGLETMGGITEKLIHRNSPIPAAVSQEFTTYQDGQTAMKIHVVQGEREKAADCRSLAEFTLRGIPPMVAGAARIRVTFTVDADGLLTVSAQELTTGIRQEVEVKPSYGLGFEEIERMVLEGMKHAREDITTRLLIEARVEAERTIQEVTAAIAADGALLKPGEGAMIEAQIARLKTMIAGENRERIDHEAHQLGALVGPFAERRMNAAIANALAGRNVDDVK